jgi:putative endonuclease
MTIAARKTRHQQGLLAEIIAALWLMLKAYRIVAWRYKTPVGEIDLIARRGNTLVFVEVKLRKTTTLAAEAIHIRNQQRVMRAAQYYLSAHPQWQSGTIRFDAVLVTWYRLPRHIAHAFSAAF